MNAHDFPTLSQLLGCYFHQDWLDEFESASDVVRAIVGAWDSTELQRGAVEIETLLALPLSNQELREGVTHQIGCYYEPDASDGDLRKWLAELRETFARA